jgi:hypothetical protein
VGKKVRIVEYILMVNRTLDFGFVTLLVKTKADGYMSADAIGTVRGWKGGFETFNVSEDIFVCVCFGGGQEPLRLGEGNKDFIYLRRGELTSGWAVEDVCVVWLLDFGKGVSVKEARPAVWGVCGGACGFVGIGGKIKVASEVA